MWSAKSVRLLDSSGLVGGANQIIGSSGPIRLTKCFPPTHPVSSRWQRIWDLNPQRSCCSCLGWIQRYAMLRLVALVEPHVTHWPLLFWGLCRMHCRVASGSWSGGGARRALPIVDSGGAVAGGLVYFVSIHCLWLAQNLFAIEKLDFYKFALFL